MTGSKVYIRFSILDYASPVGNSKMVRASNVYDSSGNIIKGSSNNLIYEPKQFVSNDELYAYLCSNTVLLGNLSSVLISHEGSVCLSDIRRNIGTSWYKR